MIKNLVFDLFIAFCLLSSSSEGSFVAGERFLSFFNASDELFSPLLMDVNLLEVCGCTLESDSTPFWWVLLLNFKDVFGGRRLLTL